MRCFVMLCYIIVMLLRNVKRLHKVRVIHKYLLQIYFEISFGAPAAPLKYFLSMH